MLNIVRSPGLSARYRQLAREALALLIRGTLQNTDTKTCAKCGDRPTGPGGVLCPECNQAISKALNDAWSPSTDS